MSSSLLEPESPSLGEESDPVAARPLRVCLLISSLEFGGAERQVIEMTRVFDRQKIDPLICTLSDKIPMAENDPETMKLVQVVPKRGRFDMTTVPRLAAYLRREKVDVLHAFMFDSEIAARLAAPLAGVPVVIASERNSDYVRAWHQQLAQRVTLPLFDIMVANSHAGARLNEKTLGLEKSRLRVVHNGVETSRFRPDESAGAEFRRRLGVGQEEEVIGMVGSFKRQKDHACFLRMAARILETRPQTRFLIAGDVIRGSADSEAYAKEMRALAEKLELGDRCLFIGNQLDIPAFYNACDFTALLSLREGTPNVALESMACGRPVIATDVADNAIIIRDGVTGYIVPSKGWEEAAQASLNLLGHPERLEKMRKVSREHVFTEYTPKRAAEKLEEIYQERFQKSVAGLGDGLKA